MSLPDVPLALYAGPKQPVMPLDSGTLRVSSLKCLARQVVIAEICKAADFEFFKSMATHPGTPEYSGYNTRAARLEERDKVVPTTAMYTPLIDLKPSDPTTMMTAMVEAQRLTQLTGQEYTVLTSDQQLFKVLVDIKWAYPEKFQNFVPRLGGMHLLMSFIGCIGTLMANSGLEEILKAGFSGMEKMLTGKKFPMNLRALRMVVEELLRDALHGMENASDLETFLAKASRVSSTSKLWVDNLINPILICLRFVRAEREGNWLLHLAAVKSTLSYFFSWPSQLRKIWAVLPKGHGKTAFVIV